MSPNQTEELGMLSLSVVTISYNCRDQLEKTVESVRSQTYEEIEHVIVDGGSEDGTVEWLSERENWFDIVVSEPDDGRYDAMNKGLELVTGDYVLFLNAGDMFHNDATIENVLSRPGIVSDRPTIVSGRFELMLNDEPLQLYRPWTSGAEGLGLPHPATMVDREVHQRNQFDEQFTYCGDYELWSRLRDKGLYDVHYVDEVVALFDAAGVSNSPDVAYARYLERKFIDYKYEMEFGRSDAISIVVIPLVRQLMQTALGQRNFIKVLRYRWLIKSWLNRVR